MFIIFWKWQRNYTRQHETRKHNKWEFPQKVEVGFHSNYNSYFGNHFNAKIKSSSLRRSYLAISFPNSANFIGEKSVAKIKEASTKTRKRRGPFGFQFVFPCLSRIWKTAVYRPRNEKFGILLVLSQQVVAIYKSNRWWRLAKRNCVGISLKSKRGNCAKATSTVKYFCLQIVNFACNLKRSVVFSSASNIGSVRDK